MLLSSRFSKIVRMAICLTLVFAMIMTVVFLPPELSPFGGSRAEDGESWLTGWSYRKAVIVNPSAGAGTNYQVLYHIHYGAGTDTAETYQGIPAAKVYLGNHSQTDFDDIRFTSSDGATLLDYYLENYTASTEATVWVEVAADLSTTAQTLYFYYGNDGVSSASNGTNTFPWFNDFTSTSLAGFTGDTAQGSISAGILTYSYGSAAWKGMHATTYVDGPGYAVRTNVSSDGINTQWGFVTSTETNRVLTYPSTTTARLTVKVNGTDYNSNLGGTHACTSYNIKELRWLPSTVVYIINGATYQSFTPTYQTFGSMGVQIQVYKDDLLFDWILVRKCVATEPTHGATGIEQSGTLIVNKETCDTDETLSFATALTGSSYAWDFDDGTTSNTRNLTHHWNVPGTYNVTLTVDSGTPYYKIITVESWAVTSTPNQYAELGTVYYYNVTTDHTATIELTTNATFLGHTGANIIGTVNTAGSYYVQIEADYGNYSSWQNYTLYTGSPVSVSDDIFTSGPVTLGLINLTYAYIPRINGTADPADRWELSTTAAWLAINATTGAVTGTPTTFGSYTVDISLIHDLQVYHQIYRLVVYDYSDISIVDNGGKSPASAFIAMGHLGTAIIDGDMLYITYEGQNQWNPSKYDDWIAAFNLTSQTKVGQYQLSSQNMSDNHCFSRIIMDANGYLHAWFGAHNSALFYSVTNSPRNITQWTLASSNFGPNVDTTYPNPYCDPLTGDIHVWMRSPQDKWVIKTQEYPYVSGWTTKIVMNYDATSYLDYLNPYFKDGELYFQIACTARHFYDGTGTYPGYNVSFFNYRVSDGYIYTVDWVNTTLTYMSTADYQAGTFLVYSNLSKDMWQPCIGSDSNGNPAIVWSSTELNYTWAAIDMAYWNGTGWEYVFGITSSSRTFLSGSAVYRYDNGDVLIYTQGPRNETNIGNPGDLKEIYYTRSTNSYNINATIAASNYLDQLELNQGFAFPEKVIDVDTGLPTQFITFETMDLSEVNNAHLFVYDTTNRYFLWDTDGETYFISSPITTATEYEEYNYQTNLTVPVTEYTLDGAPFLTVSSSGLVSGTPPAGSAGVYEMSLVAVTDIGTFYHLWTLTIEEGVSTDYYVFVTTPETSAAEGVAYSYQANTNGTEDSWNLTGTATFLTISGTGLVSGTPGAGTEGTYTVSISATIDGTTIYQNYTLEVEETPFFTSSPITTGYAGFGYNYQPTTSGEVISWSLSGGGASLYINETTGRVSSSGLGAIGTTYTLSITATTADGTYWQNYTLTVVNMFTSSPDTTGKDYKAYSYQVAARETAISWTITGPDWLTISATGLVSGTPPLGSDGVYNITVQVRTLINEVPAWSSQDYALTVLPNAAFAVTSDPVTNATANETYEYQVTSRYTVTIWNITGPDWLAINATGMITGTAPNGTQGSFNISVLLTLTDGTLAYQNYTLEVEGPPTSWSDGMAIAFGVLAFLIVVSALLSIMGSARRRY